jgi:hypothetical protein
MHDPGNADDCRKERDGAEKAVVESHQQRLRVSVGVEAPASPAGEALAIAS